MRKTTILAAGAAVLLATAALAQQQPIQQQPPTNSPAQPAPDTQPAVPAIRSINVIDMEQLPAATQARVNEVVSKRSDADLQKLRSSIDATPQVRSALEAKGLTSAEVIAASLDDNGALTLITKKKAS
jgi:hypothetical protein